jgi:MSHA biogenesis protein MshP
MDFIKQLTVAGVPCAGHAGIFETRESVPRLHFVPSRLPKRQRGISMVIVIFLLAVVSVMGLSMMKLSGTQQISSLYTLQGAQGYFAARSGMEYAVARLVGGAACANQVISGFNVSIACTPAGTYDEGNAASPYTVYRVTVTASSGNFQVPDLINRQITATVKVP